MEKRVLNQTNKVALDQFVHNALSGFSEQHKFDKSKSFAIPKLLDVGAGASPYRELIEKLGIGYESQDFNSYVPSPGDRGLQSEEWPYAEHKYVCDILDIPVSVKYDALLCTEVLEHVPDPSKAFSHITKLLKPGGTMIVTTPFMSLMHQAPFWFSSGLSPFWFSYHCELAGLEITHLSVNGDYIDFLNQEFSRFTGSITLLKPLSFLSSRINFFRPFRAILSDGLLESGGFTVTLMARKL